MAVLSINQLRLAVKIYQRRLKAGDKLPPITELASLAGIHRDTIYALLADENINQRSQYAISKAMIKVTEYKEWQTSRLLTVKINGISPEVFFGIRK